MTRESLDASIASGGVPNSRELSDALSTSHLAWIGGLATRVLGQRFAGSGEEGQRAYAVGALRSAGNLDGGAGNPDGDSGLPVLVDRATRAGAWTAALDAGQRVFGVTLADANGAVPRLAGIRTSLSLVEDDLATHLEALAALPSHLQVIVDLLVPVGQTADAQDRAASTLLELRGQLPHERTAFVPRLDVPEGRRLGGMSYLRAVAVTRLALGPDAHVVATAEGHGVGIGILALAFGADHAGTADPKGEQNPLGNPEQEGVGDPDNLERLIRQSGFEPHRVELLG